MEWKPELFPDYYLDSFLGEGPVTSVFRVFAKRLSEAGILKVLKPDFPYPAQGVGFLQREIDLLSMVQVHGIPRLLFDGIDQKLPFFVASVLEGRDLRKELSVLYSFSELKTVSIARQVLSILAYLHEKGFTHGDLKPENILISSTGEVGLVDFAFSRNLRNSNPVDAKILLGTPNYMAPELCGDAPVVSKANDVFSLGVLIYELLTGEMPFPRGGISQTLARHQSDPLARLGIKLGDFNPCLVEIVESMLAFDFENRPSAMDLMDQLLGVEIELMQR
ncbi:MAG: serine/threonine protein kinase [Gemmataceae bacterium]